MALLLAPAPADAFSWWKLDKLSGPEFQGVATGIRVKCWASSGATRAFNPDGTPRNLMPGVIFSLCPKNLRRRHSVNLDVTAGWSERDPMFAAGERIFMATVGTSISSRPNEVIEIGTGVHLATFAAEGISPVRKVMLEPIRLDLRPLQDRWDWTEDPPTAWWREAILVRAAYVWFPTGFEANELGPIADDDTLVGSIGIFLDVGF